MLPVPVRRILPAESDSLYGGLKEGVLDLNINTFGGAASDRPRQDARSAPGIQVENSERQFTDQLKKLTREKSLPGTNPPTEPLRAELHSGIFRKKIENVFLDLRQAPFTEQLHECVREATTSLMLNRTGKTIRLREEDIQKLAIAKLEATPHGLEAIRAVQDGSHRALLISRLIAHLVADAAAELLEAPTGEAYPPKSSPDRVLQVAV
jgi:hypothetical protein